MPRIPSLLLAATILTGATALPARAQIAVTQLNDEGVAAPCIALGIGAFFEKKCIDAVSRQGYQRRNELGDPGFTLGKDDKNGELIKVDSDGPAAKAGLKDGDSILAVDGKSILPTPGEAATEQIFGERGKPVTLTVSHDGTTRDVTLTRAPFTAPNPPKSLGMFLSTRPLINWRDRYIQCNAVAGPTGLPVLALCEHAGHDYGYVRASELGTTGLTFNLEDADKAVISAVAPNSPAATANLVPGDQILKVDGKPLTGYIWQKANIALFAKPGDTRTVTVREGSAEKTATLTLVPGK